MNNVGVMAGGNLFPRFSIPGVMKKKQVTHAEFNKVIMNKYLISYTHCNISLLRCFPECVPDYKVKFEEKNKSIIKSTGL